MPPTETSPLSRRGVLATRVGTRATHVTEADVRYVAQEADSANQLAAVADPSTGV